MPNGHKEKRITSAESAWSQGVVLTLIGSIVAPLCFAFFSMVTTLQLDDKKRKVEVTEKFATSYSSFLTLIAEYNNTICSRTPGFVWSPNSKTTHQSLDEHYLKIKGHLTELNQPEALLILVDTTFHSDKISAECEKLDKISERLTDSCSCESSASEVKDLLNSANDSYKVILKLMATDLNKRTLGVF